MKDEFRWRLLNVDRSRRDETGWAITDANTVACLQRGRAHPTGRISRDTGKGGRRVNPSGYRKVAPQTGCWHGDAYRLTICNEKSPATRARRSIQIDLGIRPCHRNKDRTPDTSQPHRSEQNLQTPQSSTIADEPSAIQIGPTIPCSAATDS